MGSKELYTLRENVREFLCDTFSSFETVHKIVGEMRQTAVVNKAIFEDFVPVDRLRGRTVVMTWEYYGKDSLVQLAMYEFDTRSKEWKTTEKVVRYSYGYMWPDTIELRDLLITFVAGGYDGQHFKDGIF